MRQKRIFGFVVTGLIVGWCLVGAVRAAPNPSPSAEQIAFAQQVSDLLLNELLAALFQEFDETTPDNVEHGKQAISLIFNDLNRDIRLVGVFPPLLGGNNNRASGSFERSAIQRALSGQVSTAVQEENNTWFYRRTVPLSNKFHQNCVLCHTNFTPDFFSSTNNPGEWVGMLVVSVPIR